MSNKYALYRVKGSHKEYFYVVCNSKDVCTNVTLAAHSLAFNIKYLDTRGKTTKKDFQRQCDIELLATFTCWDDLTTNNPELLL